MESMYTPYPRLASGSPGWWCTHCLYYRHNDPDSLEQGRSRMCALSRSRYEECPYRLKSVRRARQARPSDPYIGSELHPQGLSRFGVPF
jgi:hypothetical protein